MAKYKQYTCRLANGKIVTFKTELAYDIAVRTLGAVIYRNEPEVLKVKAPALKSGDEDIRPVVIVKSDPLTERERDLDVLVKDVTKDESSFAASALIQGPFNKEDETDKEDVISKEIPSKKGRTTKKKIEAVDENIAPVKGTAKKGKTTKKK